MNEKHKWILLVGGGLAVAGLFGGGIYWQYGRIDESRQEVANLRTSIDQSRQLLQGTPKLEKEVIVLRETEEAIKEILPDEEDVNNFVRDLRRFEEDSEVRITGLKKKTAPGAAQAATGAFDKVAYQLDFEGDSFQLLSFLDRIESHSRFMRVPSFKLAAASRRHVEETGVPAHKIKMDVETFVYEPQNESEVTKIEGYVRKRELLLGEIIRRQQALKSKSYAYRGPRGRRDPWVDPRIPVEADDESGLSVQEQNELVDGLATRTEDVLAGWSRVRTAENVITEMTERAELEGKLSTLEEDVRRVMDEGAIRFVPAERRLQLEVVEPITLVRAEMTEGEGGRGPTADALRELLDTMTRHLNAGEHKLALTAYSSIEPRLEAAVRDPLRVGLVESIRRRAEEARVLSEFTELDLDIAGVAIQEGIPPVALINGRAVGVGDLIDSELVIHGIRPGEIEFIFKEVILIRRF